MHEMSYQVSSFGAIYSNEYKHLFALILEVMETVVQSS